MNKKRKPSLNDVVKMQLYREELELASQDLELKRAKLQLRREQRHEAAQKQIQKRHSGRAFYIA